MQATSENAFEMLVKPVRRLIEQRGFSKPTEPQAKVIPKILDGKNVLLISPTATGKTEAAFLPVLSMLLQQPKTPGIKVLYITPLRALNRDLLERLQWWCNNLDIKLAVRHGDTEQKERTRQSQCPPDILITTPETLQAILSGWLLRQHLQALKWVVIDEVHELADSKRGSQLSLALERVRGLIGRDFQMIGLSATVGSPEKVAEFLVGDKRPVETVRVSVAKMVKLQVIFPQPTEEDVRFAGKIYTHPEVAARLRIIRDYMEKRKSVLLFTNTRSVSEVLASRFKVWDEDFPISIHHGSLAKPSRIAAETGLKRGALKGLIATSSLELGIDVGHIDLVIQYMSPRQVSRLIQRVGRAGHTYGDLSEGIIIGMDSDDTLEALVIARRALQEQLEPISLPDKPYDVLAHQIAGLLLKTRRLTFNEILAVCQNAAPYQNLTVEDVEKIIRYMHQRFPRLAWASFEDQVVLRPQRTKALFEYYFDNLSMIPEEKQFLVIDETADSSIGVLDEAFMAEYGKPGTKFIIRGSPWQIIHATEDKVYVRPVEDPAGSIPSWIGEEIPVPYEVAQELAEVRGFVEEQWQRGATPEETSQMLSERYPADAQTILHAIAETAEQVYSGFPVPTPERIVVEEWSEFVIVHSNFGSLTNRALAQLLGQVLSDKLGRGIVVQHDPYRIFVQTMGAISSERLVEVLKEIKDLPESTVRSTLTASTIKTGLFKRRVIQVARRFGALKKWADFGNVSLQKLISSFEGTPIYEEGLKEVFSKDLDADGLVMVLGRLREGKTRLQVVKTGGNPTPVARVGIERVSMKTDLIPPEQMRAVLVDSAKARLLNETGNFVCAACWDWMAMVRIKDLPDKPLCPHCGSAAIGMLKVEEEKAMGLVEKRGEHLAKNEVKMQAHAKQTAELIERYGKAAAVALSGRRISANDAKAVLEKEPRVSDGFFELVLEAERKALSRRFR
ncbi:MAG: DEAD/DEAH box helicase [Candidatus Bathyarchaeota archaeon]|nr:DEAD/DEAH box helicase [Candidatus Bathyarchaeota archaeon]